MEYLIFAVVNLGVIFVQSEIVITDLSSVVARIGAIDLIYIKARKSIEERRTAQSNKETIMKKKKKKFRFPSLCPCCHFREDSDSDFERQSLPDVEKLSLIEVKKESESVIDHQAKNSICNSIMKRASEFAGDIFCGFGEIYEVLRAIMPPGYEGWTPLGVKILGFHLKNSVLLNKMEDDDILEMIREQVTSTEEDAGRPPVNRKKPSIADDTNFRAVIDLTNAKADAGCSPVKKKQPSVVGDTFRSVSVYNYLGFQFQEDVITCPRMIDDNEFAIYYLSKEYNVNFASDFLTNPIAARFLFFQDEENDRMTLIAIAEEPAKPVIELYSKEDIEDLYVKRRQGKEPARSSELDPLCRLSQSETFRVCSQIFNSKYFAGKVRFPASFSTILDYKCQQKDVTLRRRKDQKETVYREWMALCYMSYHPFDYHPAEENTFYVSHAYNPDTKKTISSEDVFVYGVENKEIFLINSFTNVRRTLSD